MKCNDSLERMLRADPAELAGVADTDLALHIRGCDRCAAVAGTLVAELDALDQALSDFARAGDPDAAAEAARAGSPAVARSDASGASRRRAAGSRGGARDARPYGARGPRAVWRPGRRVWLPLAAAAALATVLVLGRPPVEWAEPVPPAAAPAPAFAVDPPSDRSAAVFSTSNPGITIVWLYESEAS